MHPTALVSASSHVPTHTCVHTILAGDLFATLDQYLKSYKVRFTQLFHDYDHDGNGQLDSRELGQLIKDLMQDKVTAGDVEYFQVGCKGQVGKG